MLDLDRRERKAIENLYREMIDDEDNDLDEW
jgi:hypothetical protein